VITLRIVDQDVQQVTPRLRMRQSPQLSPQARSRHWIPGTRQRYPGIAEQCHGHPRGPACDNETGNKDEQADKDHEQTKSQAEKGGTRYECDKRNREHSDDRRQVAAAVFDHGGHAIIFCRRRHSG
jgi:hypothetical protein